MENIVFDRNYELASEDNGYADAIYEKAMEPDGFFASFGKKMDAIPKIIVPEDKANFVEKEKAEGRKVIMIGDGINDSPALSAADVGIAISEGAEIAREIADITVAADDLAEILVLRMLSNRLMKRIHRNYRFIVTFNAGLILLGVGGILQPTTSALLHNTSTLYIGLKSMGNLLDEPV